MGCSYCYARKLYKRFKWNPEIRFVPEELAEWNRAKPGEKIFVGSTIELFGDWNPWMSFILDHTRFYPDITFLFLTKNPQNLAEFSPFPDNCRVGVTVTDNKAMNDALYYNPHYDAVVKFLSLEPLLERIDKSLLALYRYDWLIIGAQTKPYKPPPIEAVRELVEAADRAGIPVFLKDSLAPILPLEELQGLIPKRQEMPTK